MNSRAAIDYNTPFDIMTGFWAGVATTYDPKGNYLGSRSSRLAVYWKKPHTVIHFCQEMDLSDEMLEGYAPGKAPDRFIRLDLDLQVNGKYARGSTGGSNAMEVTGTATRPDHYHFHLQSKQGHWYNNHHFMGPDERHILGPFIGRNGEIAAVVAQTFKRMSHDVPTEFMRTPRH
jgi:hypothetical protein